MALAELAVKAEVEEEAMADDEAICLLMGAEAIILTA